MLPGVGIRCGRFTFWVSAFGNVTTADRNIRRDSGRCRFRFGRIETDASLTGRIVWCCIISFLGIAFASSSRRLDIDLKTNTARIIGARYGIACEVDIYFDKNKMYRNRWLMHARNIERVLESTQSLNMLYLWCVKWNLDRRKCQALNDGRHSIHWIACNVRPLKCQWINRMEKNHVKSNHTNNLQTNNVYDRCIGLIATERKENTKIEGNWKISQNNDSKP